MKHTAVNAPWTEPCGASRGQNPGQTAFLLVLLALVLPGCASAISTAYLREALWDGTEHAATQDPATETTARSTDADPSVPGSQPQAEAADADRREAAIQEAMRRLERIGGLDAAAQASLVETLQATQQEDWPAVIEAFSSSLAAAPPQATPRDLVERQAPATVADSGRAAAPEPVSSTDQEVAPAPDIPIVAAPVPPEPAAAAPRPELLVQHPCFARRVEGWGVVERFEADRFQPGQDVIVYFELENLSTGESPAGRTTCIDTTLTLVDAAGATAHAWRFDPISETRPTVRRDYFARYVVRIPETAAPGRCRLEIAVTDVLAGSTRHATLPLDVHLP